MRREPVDATPIWLMRQAGRYLPEYRQLREKHNFLTLSQTPELAAQITLFPLRRFDLDAAIIFSDILLPLIGMGIQVEYTATGDGPVIRNAVRSAQDVERLREVTPQESVPYVLEAIRLVKKELGGRVPLLGFSGAPFTLASYLIEGGASRNYERTKGFMIHEPHAWRNLMEGLTRLVRTYLLAQIQAGVDAIQLFDTWVGCLSPFDYREKVLAYCRRVLDGLPVPAIHFATGAAGLLPAMAQAGGQVMGVDWRVDLALAWNLLGDGFGIQGNLDPVVLLGPWEEVEKRTRSILDSVAGRPGHIFNLGHGVLPGTPPDNVARLVEFVHERGRRLGEVAK